MIIFFRYIISFVLLISAQVVVLNNIQLSGFINPYVYILFILILPFNTPKWLTLIAGFLTGLTIDMFAHTPGMHASACVLMAFLRPYIQALLSGVRDYEADAQPMIQDMGLRWFFTYVSILTLSHHSLLFFVEVFHFRELFVTLSRILLSSAFTIILLLATQYFFYKPKKNIISGKI